MKRIVTILTTLVAATLAAVPAYAQEEYPPYPPVDGDGGTVSGVGGGGDLAFTGADLAMWLAVGLALVALGVLILWLRRRRVASQS